MPGMVKMFKETIGNAVLHGMYGQYPATDGVIEVPEREAQYLEGTGWTRVADPDSAPTDPSSDGSSTPGTKRPRRRRRARPRVPESRPALTMPDASPETDE